MVKGTGIDLVDIQRLAQAVDRHPAAFRRRIYTPAEWSYCADCGHQAEALAARFAAKEAVRKALGGTWADCPWLGVEIIKSQRGVPGVSLKGVAAARAGRLGITQVLLSLTHSREQAMAMVVVE